MTISLLPSLVFIGAPGSGKGTQAKLLAEKYNYSHISTGDILRQHVAQGTSLGLKVDELLKSGLLVSDELMIEMIGTTLRTLKSSFILDGFPRTMDQARALVDLFKQENIDYRIIYFNIDSSLLIERLINRRSCSGCGAIYNITSERSLRDTCPKCGGKIVHRKDDMLEVVEARIGLYEKSTKPVIDFYKNSDRFFIDVDSSKDEHVVFDNIKKRLSI